MARPPRVMKLDRRLLGLASRGRFAILVTAAAGVLAGLLVIGQAALISRIVAEVFLAGGTLAQVQPWMWALLVVIAGRALLVWLSEISAGAVARAVKSWLRDRFFERLLQLGPAYTRRRRTGELTAAATEGIEALEPYFGQFLPQLLIAVSVPVSILAVVFRLDPLSGFILLFTAPLIPFFMYMIGGSATDTTRRQYAALGRLSAHFLDSVQGLTTLKVFGQAKAQIRNIARVSEEFRQASLRVLRTAFLSAFALEFLATISTAIIAVEVGLRLLAGRLEFQQALFILVLAPEFYLPLRTLGVRFHAAVGGRSAAERIFEVLDERVEFAPEPVALAAAAREPRRYPATLRFEDVSYVYPEGDDPALSRIDLEIRRGEHVAIVGPSGAGKSTLASLVLGFVRPTTGRLTTIYADGSRDLGAPPADLVGWVPQKPHLFHDTLAANLRFGAPAATNDQLDAAVRAARLDELVQALPDGYDSVIGEGGARLSSGEAQRLAFARAYLKDAPILILDEPSSSLDPLTEQVIEESTSRLSGDRIVVTIAHRLNTVYRADRIIVLDRGRIEAEGTHEALMGAGGPYARMVAASHAGSVDAGPAGQDVREAEKLPSAGSPAAPHAVPDRVPASASPETGPGGVASSVLVRLLSFLRGSWWWILLAVALGGLTIGSSVALLGTSAWLISAAALHPALGELGLAIVGVRFFGIARAVFRYLERLVSHNVTFQLLSRLRTWFFARLEPLAPARLIEHRAGDVLARFLSDVQTLEDFYVRVVGPPATALVVVAGTSWYLGRFDLRLPWVAISIFALLGMAVPALARRLGRTAAIDLVAQRAELHAQLVDGIQGIAEIKAFGRVADRLRRVARVGQSYTDSQRRVAGVAALQSGLAAFLQHLGLWLVLLVCIPRVASGQLGGVMLASLALLTLAAFEAAAPLPLAGHMLTTTRLAARRLFQIVDSPPAVADHPAGAGIIGTSARALPSIEFDHLSFTYPGATAPAVAEITFEVHPGGSVAIVGASGAGKSTLLNLMLRFWDYRSGEIRIDGASLKLYLQDEVRARLALVAPNTYFFNASILENIRLARPHASRQQVELAAREAELHDFVLGLPEGYETWVGEGGVRLSAGECQRLGIARAILKDAPVLLLDEPTANLDPETEHKVLNNLFGLMRSKTSILVTHRLVGLTNVGQILVMDAGRVVERGTHLELVERNGLYCRLWELQNRILD